MRHSKLFLATVTVLFGSVAALRADPFPESSSTKVSMLGLVPSLVTASPNSSSTSTFAFAPASSPVVEIAARRGLESRPQEMKPGPDQRTVRAVAPPCRPTVRRVRLSPALSRSPVRVAKPAVASRVAAPRVFACLAGPSEPRCGAAPYTRVVLLGVGF